MTEWKIPGIFKADAEKVGEEVESLGDQVRPQDVLEFAKKNTDSELHKCFTWDNDKAAEKYRLIEARRVIQFLVISPATETTPAIREYQITSVRGTYQKTQRFLKNEDEYTTLLQRAKYELAGIKARYSTLSELEDVMAAIDDL